MWTESAKPVSVFQKLLDDYSQLHTSRWIGIMGDNHVPRFNSTQLLISVTFWLHCPHVLAYVFVFIFAVGIITQKTAGLLKTEPRIKFRNNNFPWKCRH